MELRFRIVFFTPCPSPLRWCETKVARKSHARKGTLWAQVSSQLPSCRVAWWSILKQDSLLASPEPTICHPKLGRCLFPFHVECVFVVPWYPLVPWVSQLHPSLRLEKVQELSKQEEHRFAVLRWVGDFESVFPLDLLIHLYPWEIYPRLWRYIYI